MKYYILGILMDGLKRGVNLSKLAALTTFCAEITRSLIAFLFTEIAQARYQMALSQNSSYRKMTYSLLLIVGMTIGTALTLNITSISAFADPNVNQGNLPSTQTQLKTYIRIHYPYAATVGFQEFYHSTVNQESKVMAQIEQQSTNSLSKYNERLEATVSQFMKLPQSYFDIGAHTAGHISIEDLLIVADQLWNAKMNMGGGYKPLNADPDLGPAPEYWRYRNKIYERADTYHLNRPTKAETWIIYDALASLHRTFKTEDVTLNIIRNSYKHINDSEIDLMANHILKLRQLVANFAPEDEDYSQPSANHSSSNRLNQGEFDNIIKAVASLVNWDNKSIRYALVMALNSTRLQQLEDLPEYANLEISFYAELASIGPIARKIPHFRNNRTLFVPTENKSTDHDNTELDLDKKPKDLDGSDEIDESDLNLFEQWFE